jgi:hypothetical protein
MKKAGDRKNALRLDAAALDALIEEITVDANGEDEQLWAFRQAFEDNVDLPCDGTVVGEPVTVIAFDYDGNERRGLTAKCRGGGQEHVVSAADVAMPLDSVCGRYLAAYRKWMGLVPFPPIVAAARGQVRKTAAKAALEITGPIELVVLSLTQKAARCRLLTGAGEVTLRATRLWDAVPGEIVAVHPRKKWSYAGHPYLSGKIESTRLSVDALDLVPLKLEDRGEWNPAEHYWGEEGEPIDEWARPIIARGSRREFEMEQVLPGANPEEFYDPIGESNDLKDSGDLEGAHKILMDLCQADLRCLDAHAHLGNQAFDHWPKEALRHYEVGFQIGELSLEKDFDGVLQWGWIDNRPFLRCMHGFGLCLWRVGRFEEARHILNRMLWLNPSDNQGARFLIHELEANVAWEDSKNR